MSTLKRITINSDEECVVQIMHKGIKMAELLVSIHDIEYRANDQKSNVKVTVYNPHGFGEQEITTVKYSKD